MRNWHRHTLSHPVTNRSILDAGGNSVGHSSVKRGILASFADSKNGLPAWETVHRSAITLKLLTFELTGAIVAAATFSLPEGTNGEGRK